MKQNYIIIPLPLTCPFVYFTLNDLASGNIQRLLLYLWLFFVSEYPAVYMCVLIITILGSDALYQPSVQNSHDFFNLPASTQCDKEQLLQQE